MNACEKENNESSRIEDIYSIRNLVRFKSGVSFLIDVLCIKKSLKKCKRQTYRRRWFLNGENLQAPSKNVTIKLIY